jgi:hypothetical protein
MQWVTHFAIFVYAPVGLFLAFWLYQRDKEAR